MKRVKCSICQKPVCNRGLYLHTRNEHKKELDKVGWKKIKSQAKEFPSQKEIVEKLGIRGLNKSDLEYFENILKKRGDLNLTEKQTILLILERAEAQIIDVLMFINIIQKIIGRQ